MRSWATSLWCLWLVLAAAAAWATPPQIVSVHDTLFARNEDTLLIRRRIEDNRGRHGVLQTDTLIVFRSLTDGADLGFLREGRMLENHIEGPRVTFLPLTSPANPYEVRQGGFWPLRMPLRWREEGFLTAEGLTIRDQGQPLYHLPFGPLKSHISDTLIAARGVFPVLYQEGESDPLDPYAFDPVRECDVASVLPLDEAPDDPALAYLRCEDADTGQQASLWVVVPKVD